MIKFSLFNYSGFRYIDQVFLLLMQSAPKFLKLKFLVGLLFQTDITPL